MMFSNIIDYPQESLFPNVQQINPFRTPNFPHQMGSSLSSSFLTQQPLNYEVTPSYFPNYPSVLYKPICNQELEALPSAKKDRHTKISTAQGVRVRRVRLSMGIAREFFDLQDLLGFDKASKTLAWLLAKSKGAIHELALEKEGVGLEGKEDLFGSSSSGALIRKRRRKRKRVGSDFGREQLCSKRAITSAICKVEGIEKGSDGISQGGCCYNSLVVREKRARARARARARTREKLSAMTEPVQFDHHGLLGNHESGYYGSKLDVDSKAQGFNDCKFVDSDGVINGVKGHDLSCLGYSQNDPIAPRSDNGFVRVNHLPNSAGHEDTFSSYWGWNICDLYGVDERSLY